jgi:hypothetical protein
MSDGLLGDLLRVLDLVVIEHLPNQMYTMLTPAPDWLTGTLEAAPAGSRATLGGAMPFLDDFLPQAEAIWHEHSATPVMSTPFAATVDGEEYLLRATVLTLDGRALLILERLTGEADTRPMLQKARDHQLEREQLDRKVSTVHAPAQAIEQQIAQLLATPLTPDQQQLAESIRDAAAQLQATMADLPAPPKARRQMRS